MSSSRIAIIGAGLTGAYLAWKLSQNTRCQIQVIDKSRGTGGRLASKRINVGGQDWVFSHGNPVIDLTADAELLKLAQDSAWIKPSTDSLTEISKWVGSPTANVICKNLLVGIPTQFSKEIKTASELSDFDWVISTAPGPQSAALFAESTFVADLKKIVYHPSFAWMVVVDRPLQPAGIFVNAELQGQASGCYAYVLRLSSGWTSKHLNIDLEAGNQVLLNEFEQIFAQASVLSSQLHRWRYSTLDQGLDNYWIDIQKKWAAAGDGFCGGQMSGAIQSAKALVKEITQKL